MNWVVRLAIWFHSRVQAIPFLRVGVDNVWPSRNSVLQLLSVVASMANVERWWESKLACIIDNFIYFLATILCWLPTVKCNGVFRTNMKTINNHFALFNNKHTIFLIQGQQDNLWLSYNSSKAFQWKWKIL